MATENYQAWSKTAATNDGIDAGLGSIADTSAPDTVDNWARGLMAAAAKHEDDVGGGLSAGGTANALTVTTNQGLISGQIADGLHLSIYATADNTLTTVTFASDGLTAANIKRADGSALAVGSIKNGMLLQLFYKASASEWRCANIGPTSDVVAAVTKRVFTTPGASTYTPTTGMAFCVIECVGGGGGGGGTNGVSAGNGQSGGGGGGGGYSRLVATAATIGVSKTITIGAGGTAGTSTVDGGGGGNTSVGSLCIANGGGGGGSSPTTAAGVGAAGGAAGTGDFSVPGGPGSHGVRQTILTLISMSGSGGHAALGFGAGGRGLIANAGAAGIAGSNYGGGGGSGNSWNGSGDANGSVGAPGIVFITEYIRGT